MCYKCIIKQLERENAQYTKLLRFLLEELAMAHYYEHEGNYDAFLFCLKIPVVFNYRNKCK